MELINTFKTKAEKIINEKSLLIIFILYIICNVFFLTNNFLFWDDWCLTGNTFKDVIEFYKGPGTCPWTVLFMEIIYHIPPFIARWIIFGLYFSTAVCIEKILKFLDVKASPRFCIVLLYTLNPVVIAKYALIDASYYFGQSLFFVAAYLIICHKKTKKVYYGSLVLFFLSFTTRSLLCFYAVPISVLFYKECICDWKGFRSSVIGFIKQYYLFFIIPFAFYAYAHFYLKPTGLYAAEKYNSIQLGLLVKKIYNSFFKSLTNIINWLLSINLTVRNIRIFIITLLLLSFVFDRSVFWILLISLIMFLFARIPYVAVGKEGFIGNAIESRHFMLVPLPISLFIYSVLVFLIRNTGKLFYSLFILFFPKTREVTYINAKNWVLRKELCCIVFAIIFIQSALLNIEIGKNVFEDTVICESIIENFKEEDDIRNNETFALTTNTQLYGAFLRATVFTDYRIFGLYWKAFGNQKHFSYNTQYETPENLEWYYENRNYSSVNFFKIRDITNAPVSHQINIETTNALMSKKFFLKSYVLYLFNRKQYLNYIKDVVKVSVNEI